MRKELDEALTSDFPLLYRDRHGNMRQTCMVWGFPGDGWEPLIRRLSEKLETLIQEYKDSNPDVPDYELPRAVQVKEKFGGLRFYMSHYLGDLADVMVPLIMAAEEESLTICERCGAPGELRGRKSGRAWILTLCDDCHTLGHPSCWPENRIRGDDE